ncbi:MAG TPA: thioredoxin domain-containing protein [Patescibacteria group bacterium]|jgi:protein-disulfide isomerase|nr:thioredoxin domain-containing protein [Patescibacteria group bacterium]
MTKEAKILIGIAILVIAGGVLLAIYANPRAAEPGKPVDEKSLIRDTSHMTKQSSAKVNIVEFGDYQCPGCGAAYPILKQVLDKYKDNNNVNFVFRNFPLETIHPNARVAAEAAEAAAAQGKFWEMHDLLYEKQTEWSTQDDPTIMFADYAASLGLNVDTFKLSISQALSKDIIKADIDDGNALQVAGTPTFFLNGVLFAPTPGHIPTADEFTKKIDEELAK